MKKIPKTLYFLSCYDSREIISFPEENVSETLQNEITNIYNNQSKKVGYGNKLKLEVRQYSFYLSRTHSKIFTLLCVDNGYPGNIVHNMFNEIEAMESLESIESCGDHKSLIQGNFSNIFEKNKTILVEEIEEFDNLEKFEEETRTKAFIFRKDRSELKRLDSWRKMKLGIVVICIILCLALVTVVPIMLSILFRNKTSSSSNNNSSTKNTTLYYN